MMPHENPGAVTKTTPPTVTIEPASDPGVLLTMAVKEGLDVEKLEKLMGLWERWREKEHERELNASLSAFQEECPVIPRTKEVKKRNGELLYRYAPLDEILATVRPILRRHQLSVDFNTLDGEDGAKTIVCFLRHANGFWRSSSFRVPTIQGSNTNAAQDEGSKNTYGRRYALQNLLGIAPEEDDDGASALPENLVWLVKHNDIVRENLLPIMQVKDFLAEGSIEAAAEVVAEMSMEVSTTLWRAPRHGGMWTTEEKKAMKSKAFADMVHERRKESDWYDREENQL